jgi:hypothetical protein
VACGIGMDQRWLGEVDGVGYGLCRIVLVLNEFWRMNGHLARYSDISWCCSTSRI